MSLHAAEWVAGEVIALDLAGQLLAWAWMKYSGKD